MKSEAQTPSSSRPSVGATAVPVAETAVAETSVMEAPAETPGAEAPIAPSSLPAPMEKGEQVMANHGLSRWRLGRKNHFRGAGQLNAPTLNPGGMS